MNVHRIDKATEKVVNTESWDELPEETDDYLFVVQAGAGIDWSLVDGVLVPPPSPPPPPPTVPAKVHKYWLVEELLAQGKMASLRAILNANDEARERWEASNEVYRSNPLVDWFAALQEMTSADMDGLFIAAAARQATAQI